MAHGISEMLSIDGNQNSTKQQQQQHNNARKNAGVMGSRRIFSPAFKIKVLDSYRHDLDCRGNQRATARKYNIHRRQIQKWLQCEDSLRSSAATALDNNSAIGIGSPSPDSIQQPQPQPQSTTLNPSRARLHGDAQQQQPPPPLPVPQPSGAATDYQFLAQRYDYAQGQVIYSTPAEARPAYHRYSGFQPSTMHYGPCDQPTIVGDDRAPIASPESPMLQAKKELRLDIEEFSSGISDIGSSNSPIPSHLESLPPSPRESTGYSGSDSEADSSSGQHSIGTNNAAVAAVDLARRRSFSLHFKLRVLDAFHSNDTCKRNQRATARKYNINRRQVQKWLSQERELRDLMQRRGANRQRLGSHSPAVNMLSAAAPVTTTAEETPVDLRTGAGILHNGYRLTSPNGYAENALTPPYSQPGCTLSCCSQERPTYLCYSPLQLWNNANVQEQPLCLVKPKEEPVPTAPTPKKDAILFRPYLDNPVSRPALAVSNNNNGRHETCSSDNLVLSTSFRFQDHVLHQQAYPVVDVEHVIPQLKSAFVRYPKYLQ